MVDNYYYLPNAFDTGSADISPELWELKDDTEHPQFNARQFMYEISTRNEEPKGFLPFFCDIDTANGLFAVATNTFTSHNWDGNAIGAKDFNTIVNHDIANIAFSFTSGGTVTCLKWLQPTVLALGNMNGKVQVFNSTSEFKIGSQSVDGYATQIELLEKEQMILVGTSNGNFSIFDCGRADLVAVCEIPFGHAAHITGVSAHPSYPKCWASCSIDRTCLMWDKRQTPPASGVLRNYEYELTSVKWTSQAENKDLVMVGDAAGNVLTLDTRCPNKILSKTRVAKREITKLCFNGSKRFGVVAQTNVASIYEADGDNEIKKIDEHHAPGIIYSMCSDPLERGTFYVVGERKYAKKFSIAS